MRDDRASLLGSDADAKLENPAPNCTNPAEMQPDPWAGLPAGAALRFGRFKLRQLALVIKLTETGNLHDAAAALYMSQPAATKLLQELEEALDVTLFIRHARGMKPTPSGIMAARHASFILTELGKMQEGVGGLRHGITGYVQVGATMAAVPGAVIPALAMMAEAHPTVEVSLTVGTGDVLLRELNAGRLDFVVSSVAGLRDVDRLTYSPLLEEVPVIVAGAANPVLRQHGLRLEDIFSHHWILPPADTLELRAVEAAFHVAGLPLPVRSTRMASMIAMATLVQTSDMLAVVPESVFQYFSRFQVLGRVDVHLRANVERYGLISANNRPLSPAAGALHDFIRDVCLRPSFRDNACDSFKSQAAE